MTSDRFALISVSDKRGVVPFARALCQLGFRILSTGGTFKLLCQEGVAATEVSEYTAFEEMMDGRVKTLHPKIHGGILGRRGVDDAIMERHGIGKIDIVCVNLYPFVKTVSQKDVRFDDAIENIDIGGPAMVRSAAKNHAHVGVITDPSDYDGVIQELQERGALSDKTRFDLAVKAFEHTAAYDGAIANWLGARLLNDGETLSDVKPKTAFARAFHYQSKKAQELRYGENPHQRAAFYVDDNPPKASVAQAKQLQGKELSFNNIADTDAALECVKSFDKPACVIVKHANPCGVATAEDVTQAYLLAYATDPESAFGGIIAFNRELDASAAKAIVDRQFVEVAIAPSVSDEALAIFASKKNARVLACGPIPAVGDRATQWDIKRVGGGVLVQDQDSAFIDKADLKVVTERAPTDEEMEDLLFAWKVAKYVKSNAIVYAKNHQTVGIGAGQMSRVNSARIAAIKAESANLSVQGAAMASDAFLPFRDGVDNAAKAGVTCIVQPGGSVRDAEVIAAANEHGVAMVFTGVRHFRH